MKQKIAVPTDDGITISKHFGQAAYFKVIDLEDGQFRSAEIRKKVIHHHGNPESEGMHPGHQMVESIADCQVLISGGMGSPVYERAIQSGLSVVLTRQQDIDLAIQEYVSGKLKNEPDLVHVH